MIFLKFLLLLLVFVAVDSDQQSDEYIIFATEHFKRSGLGYASFVKINFRLTSLTFHETPTKPSKPPYKLFFGSNAFYGHLKDSDEIARFDPSSNEYKSVNIMGAKDMLFIGPDSEDNLYFYSPTSKTISVYKFDEPTKIQKDLKGLESEDKVVVIGRDQCNKDWVYLLRCSSSNNSAFIFDLKKDSIVFEYPNIKPPECFDFWGVSPNGEKIYYLEHTTYDNEPRTIIHEITRLTLDKTHTENRDLKIFAPGNNELFFGYNGYEHGLGYKGTLERIVLDGKRGRPKITEIAPAKASAIAVHQPTEECWNPKSTS